MHLTSVSLTRSLVHGKDPCNKGECVFCKDPERNTYFSRRAPVSSYMACNNQNLAKCSYIAI